MAEEGPLEPLVIIEEGDETTSVSQRRGQSGPPPSEPSRGGEPSPKEEEGGNKHEDAAAAATVRSEPARAREEENRAEEGENTDEEQKGRVTQQKGENVKENPEDDGEDVDNQLPVDPESSEQQAGGTKSPEEDPQQSPWLTQDFPEALYELLCTLQEGRRLNDQRCSFRMESGVRRRRCHSEPNTTKPANRVFFSSVTSLQREELFELVATAQARRLDDQRARFQKSPLQKSKARSIRGSIKQLSFARKPPAEPTPAPAPKEDLYDMILTTQAQGRLEDQRSRAPGPMDDDDFFSLLLRVQGGRMEEQRTELPCVLQT